MNESHFASLYMRDDKANTVVLFGTKKVQCYSNVPFSNIFEILKVTFREREKKLIQGILLRLGHSVKLFIDVSSLKVTTIGVIDIFHFQLCTLIP